MEVKMGKYQQKSLVYEDDSILFIDTEAGKEIWGFREYKNGRYTGDIRLENGDIIERRVASGKNLESSFA